MKRQYPFGARRINMLCAGAAITPMLQALPSYHPHALRRRGHHPHALPISPCISPASPMYLPVSPLYLAGSGITPMLQALRRLVAEPSDTTEVAFSPSPSP